MTNLFQTWKWHALLACVAAGLCVVVLSSITHAQEYKLPSLSVSEPFPLVVHVAQDALQAEAAIIYDPATGHILFQKNADMPLPLASLTKLMAADVVLGQTDTPASVVITHAHTAEVHDAGDLGLRPGQLWSVGELVRYGLFTSSNNAMLAAAGAAPMGGTATIATMNERAKEFGMSESRFYNSTGLDITDTLSGGYGSARDVAVLAANFYRKYPVYFETTMRAEAAFGPDDNAIAARPTAGPIMDIPGVLAAKTG